jgi:hypothetical protein
MSYIGQQPVVGRYILLDQISGGFNGTATGFTMAAGGQGVLPGLAQNVLLSLGGVIQQPGVDYLISGSGLTFTTAPVSGTTFFATVLGDMQAVGTPSDGTVLPASIASSGTFVFPNVTTTGTTLIASGTAGAPSLAVIGDVNTGLYSPGADQLAVSTGGTGRLFVDASGNIGVGMTPVDVAGFNSVQLSDTNGTYLDFYTSSTQQARILSLPGDLRINQITSGTLGFWTSNTERMRLDSAGRVGIGTTDMYGTLNVQRNAAAQYSTISLGDFANANNSAGIYGRVGSSGIFGISSAGAPIVFYNGGSGTGEVVRIDSSGRLGVGTSTPGTALEVMGYIQTQSGAFGGGGYNFKYSAGNAASRSWQLQTDAVVYGDFAIQQSTTQTGSTYEPRLYISAAGNIGIGTSSQILFVDKELNINNATGSTGFSLSTGGLARLYFTGNSTAGNITTKGSIPLLFGTNETERMRLDANGRLGVGTSSPGYAFDCVASPSGVVAARFRGNSSANDNVQIRFFGANAATDQWAVGNAVATDDATRNFDIFDLVSNANRLRIDSSGRVGIGTTVPSALLHVNQPGVTGGEYGVRVSQTSATSNALRLTIDSTNTLSGLMQESTVPLVFGTNNTERARIDSSGRLLVGTSSGRPFANFGGTTQLCIEGTSYPTGSLSLTTNQALVDGSYLILAKSRGTSVGSVTSVNNGDLLGSIWFQGADGANLVNGAWINAVVDSTPGTADMPTCLVFSTTADGASSPTERLRLESNGNARFSNLATIYPTTDNAVGNGGSGFRWSAIWAANGTIQTSDQRAKTAIVDAKLGSSFIKSLRPVSYKWVEGGKRDTGNRDKDGNYMYESVPGTRTHWGFIAQEVKAAVDAAGVDFGGWVLTDKEDPDSQQALRYDQFIAPLTKALQEALVEIDVLKAKVAALEGV